MMKGTTGTANSNICTYACFYVRTYFEECCDSECGDGSVGVGHQTFHVIMALRHTVLQYGRDVLLWRS
jgi:hypothetical protein